ncbi:hypothetical protein AAFC00_004323 [Neodothiora populina]|uniref:Transcription factor domain-containing protein n=1 Tax=Neodothiora populina TaxID=2781224 RepID=A0ABR3PJL1_9PEZI
MFPTRLEESPSPVSRNELHVEARYGGSTVDRELSGVLVHSYEIDELFHIFFRDYHKSMPVLKSKINPNECYSDSVSLFWSIIVVAARVYPKNPNLYMDLSQDVIELAFLSPATTPDPLLSIKGKLLILTWSPARAPTKRDSVFVLAGLLVHEAKQAGLHTPKSSHEFGFARDRRLRLSEAEHVERANLWALCVLVYQRSCTCKGHLPNNLNEIVSLSQSRFLDPTLRLQLRCQDIVSKFVTAIAGNGVQNMSLDQRRAMDILIQAFTDQVDLLERDAKIESGATVEDAHSHIAVHTMTSLDTCAARLHIQSFWFYKEHNITFGSPLARLLNTACAAITLIDELCKTPTLPPSPPNYLTYVLLGAVYYLLRIIKTPSDRYVDLERAASHLSLGLRLLKKVSVHNNDTSAKSALLLTQLWNDPLAFKGPDGTADVALKVHNRLGAAPVLDTICRWYDLHDEQQAKQQSDPYTMASHGADENTANASSHTNDAPVTTPGNPDGQFGPVLFEDDILSSFDWTMNGDFFSI